jgi:hypothetical protein
MRNRTKTYHQMRLDSVTELNTNSTLYKSGAMILSPDDRLKGEELHEGIRAIIKSRKKFARESSGLSRMSKQKQQTNHELSESLRMRRSKDVRINP